MQLNQATDYALRAVMYLVNSSPQEAVPAQIIAESEEIPMRFLLKIMRSLIQAGIIKSYRGIEGGYALAQPPAEITLLDVKGDRSVIINLWRLDQNIQQNGLEREIHNARNLFKTAYSTGHYNFENWPERKRKN
jgi:Rrf2 family protein